MASLIGSVAPNRAPNSDFGGLSYQPNGGNPVALRGTGPPFPGAPNRPGSGIGIPNVLRDTSGKRSNVTVPYHRIVSMATEEEQKRVKGIKQGQLMFAGNNMAARRSGKGVERVSVACGLDYLSDTYFRPAAAELDTMSKAGALPTDPNAYEKGFVLELAPVDPNDAQAVLESRTDLFVDVDNPADFFSGLGVDEGRPAADGCPFLMPKDWDRDDKGSLRFAGATFGGDKSIGAPYTYTEPEDGGNTRSSSGWEDDPRVRLLWTFVYNDRASGIASNTCNGLLGEACLGRFRPDGILLYKYHTEKDEVMEMQMDAQQNGTFNIVVSGHTTMIEFSLFEHGASSKRNRWVMMPRDVAYLLVVGTYVGGGIFANLRYVRSTSEELRTCDKAKNRYAMLEDGTFGDPPAGKNFILGAYRIGSIIDSAATRALANASGNTLNDPSTMGVTISVGIRWVTSYDLHDLYYDGGQ